MGGTILNVGGQGEWKVLKIGQFHRLHMYIVSNMHRPSLCPQRLVIRVKIF